MADAKTKFEELIATVSRIDERIRFLLESQSHQNLKLDTLMNNYHELNGRLIKIETAPDIDTDIKDLKIRLANLETAVHATNAHQAFHASAMGKILDWGFKVLLCILGALLAYKLGTNP